MAARRRSICRRDMPSGGDGQELSDFKSFAWASAIRNTLLLAKLIQGLCLLKSLRASPAIPALYRPGRPAKRSKMRYDDMTIIAAAYAQSAEASPTLFISRHDASRVDAGVSVGRRAAEIAILSHALRYASALIA